MSYISSYIFAIFSLYVFSYKNSKYSYYFVEAPQQLVQLLKSVVALQLGFFCKYT